MNNGLLGVPQSSRTGLYQSPWVGLAFYAVGRRYPIKHPFDRTPFIVRALYRNKVAQMIYTPGMVIQDMAGKYNGGAGVGFSFVMKPFLIEASLQAAVQIRPSNANLIAAATPASWEVAFMVIA